MATYTPIRPLAPSENRILARVQASLAEQATQAGHWQEAGELASRAEQTMGKVHLPCFRCANKHGRRAWISASNIWQRPQPMAITDAELALRIRRVQRKVQHAGGLAGSEIVYSRDHQTAVKKVLVATETLFPEPY